MHKQFLLEALDQAWLGRGRCAPNPSVGAVAVRDNSIIARAYHQGAGTPHAEQLLIQSCDQDLAGTTLYVTLEPCNHWGKTPPCVDAIVEAGFAQVVYAYSDPNPLIKQNDTPALLREYGIDVVHFPLAEIDAFYQSYRHWLLTEKPWVTVKMAQSLDGKIAGRGGEPVLLSNETCSQFTHQQRVHSDVLLTSVNTIINDDPRFDARLEGIITKKDLAIIDSSLRLPLNAKIFSTAAHIHVYHDAGYSSKSLRPCQYHPTAAHQQGLDLAAIIAHLGQLGYHDVWVEVGAKLFAALHQASLVNRSFIYLVPKVLGENALSGYDGQQIFKRRHQATWQSQEDNSILCLDWLED